MDLPIHQPYENGKGGVEIGLRPIEDIAWLELDNLFTEEIKLKKKLFREKRDQVLMNSPDSIDLQQEVLELVLNHLNKFHSNSFNLGKKKIESIKSEDIFHFKDYVDPIELASLLVQEDLIVMKPKNNTFSLESASLCAPTRWSLKEKFGQTLSQIHSGVPGYKEKIDSRVEKIFTNLPDEKIFERFNWSIFDSPELFQPAQSKSLVEIKNIDPKNLFLRVERQTIRRLNKSKSILFTVRVHVDQITAVLSCEKTIAALLLAIKSLDEDMKSYKVIKPFEENLINWLKSKLAHE